MEEHDAKEAAKEPSLDERLANIERDVKKIKRRVTAMVVGNYLHFALILGSIILATVLLPPLLGDVWSQYSELLQGGLR